MKKFAPVIVTNKQNGIVVTYFEVYVAATAGILQPRQSSGMIMMRIRKSNWFNFTQTNDYSFDATATVFTSVTSSTGYVLGTLNNGIESN